MYFSLFKSNYVPKFFTYYQYKNIFKKTKQKLQDTVKRKKNQLYANNPGFTITVIQNKKKHTQIWQVYFHRYNTLHKRHTLSCYAPCFGMSNMR